MFPQPCSSFMLGSCCHGPIFKHKRLKWGYLKRSVWPARAVRLYKKGEKKNRKMANTRVQARISPLWGRKYERLSKGSDSPLVCNKGSRPDGWRLGFATSVQQRLTPGDSSYSVQVVAYMGWKHPIWSGWVGFEWTTWCFKDWCNDGVLVSS